MSMGKVGVGVCTRRRPEMLAALLQSFARMDRPEGAEVVFIVVENEPTLSAATRAAAHTLSEATGCTVLTEPEPKPGIPMARNRVLDTALANGCDYLTFVDDDELVRSDWLVNLLDGLRAQGLDLAGGPVNQIGGDQELTPMQQACLEFVRKRGAKRNATRQAHAVKNEDKQFAVYTNNWCADLAAVRRLGVRFDETLQFTGGEDTRFSLDMSAAGAKVGWVAEAVVDEIMPPSRLTLSYQYARARDQTITTVQLRKLPFRRIWGYALSRLMDALVNALVAPIAGRTYLVKAAHKLGIAVGRWRGYFGKASSHYAPGTETVHGDTKVKPGS
ncbi:glycosyltransferase family 2 protein [Tropicibacter naphthalenivorans]|uniref:Mycofactocin system glycosyltransferase n=1 Tax=Tropicibacter naphthalenivorans TaxID=441103 RepID=A0A0N7LZA2_9RHOB|nr:glycosyltransferase family 2 protein [Tropicibacter naphthalenivorans]CUH77097.1 mycofactocin system glycosyltransferase [Tropicibacter naphthalenivorans]SMC60758.1 Glycosyltransferase, GT2 family [Tropicibacter naphthalenivorans]